MRKKVTWLGLGVVSVFVLVIFMVSFQGTEGPAVAQGSVVESGIDVELLVSGPANLVLQQ